MANLVCSECFKDEGLKLTVERYGIQSSEICPTCGNANGSKISKKILYEVCWEFFVAGSFYDSEFGGASQIMFNEYQKTEVDFGSYIKSDVAIIEKELGIGFFYYAPRLFNVGIIEQLEKINSSNLPAVQQVLEEIIEKFPVKIINIEKSFYRLRKNLSTPIDELQFDSPPSLLAGNGRLDSKDLNILYGSEDIEICLHECRVAIGDELFLAQLVPSKALRILDLNSEIEEDGTEFESLSLSIKYIFRAAEHSYDISRKIASFIHLNGFDGIIFPSYFSRIKAQIIPNIALFGSPIKEGKLHVKCIDRIIINTVDYTYRFGALLNS